jgi:hypothetical protein
MYPVQYTAEWVERRSRLSTFFRLILVIPALIFSALYGFAALFVVFVAWFALLFTGRYPEGMYRFVSGALRNAMRTTAYYNLVTDVYPPFDGKDETPYPVRITIAPPQERYSRLKVLFRGILMIPIYVVAYVFALIYQVGAFAAWFVIVFTGKMPKGLQDIIDMGLRYTVRANAYYWLITEDWPPLTDPAASGPAPAYEPPVSPTR